MRIHSLAIFLYLLLSTSGWCDESRIDIEASWLGVGSRVSESYSVVEKDGVFELAGTKRGDFFGQVSQETTYTVRPIARRQIEEFLELLKEPTRENVKLEDVVLTQEELSRQAKGLVEGLAAGGYWDKGAYQAWSDQEKSFLVKQLQDADAVVKALTAYFSGEAETTDDFPAISVKVTQHDSPLVHLQSENGARFMLPWKITIGDKTMVTYNLNISQRLAALLPDGAAQRERLMGVSWLSSRVTYADVARAVELYYQRELWRMRRE